VPLSCERNERERERESDVKPQVLFANEAKAHDSSGRLPEESPSAMDCIMYTIDVRSEAVPMSAERRATATDNERATSV
jgi:hypothetical protein